MKKALLIIFLLCFTVANIAQTDTPQIREADTVRQNKQTQTTVTRRRASKDSFPIKRKADTALVVSQSIADTIAVTDTALYTAVVPIKKLPLDSFYKKLLDNPFLRTNAKPIFLVINERQRSDKDEIFYLLAGMIFFLAFIRLVFGHYFSSMYRLFLQPTFRQKQTREQLLQNNLPSLLLNLFFVLSMGAYAAFLLQFYQLTGLGFWLTFIYSCVCLAFIYFGKYISLVFAGWVFNVREASEAYIFAVYLVNKIMGVVLVPFTLILAFSKNNILSISVPVSLIIVLLLFGYRYIVSIVPVGREIKVSPIHFLLYVCACEVIPILVIYKTLNTYLNHSV